MGKDDVCHQRQRIGKRSVIKNKMIKTRDDPEEPKRRQPKANQSHEPVAERSDAATGSSLPNLRLDDSFISS
jgi:hypothetical protein